MPVRERLGREASSSPVGQGTLEDRLRVGRIAPRPNGGEGPGAKAATVATVESLGGVPAERAELVAQLPRLGPAWGELRGVLNGLNRVLERRTMPDTAAAEIARELRLRRLAERQGLVLQKSRRRDTRLYDYGRYFLLDARSNFRVCSEFGLDLDEVAAALED
jgi:hypothetical protein